MSASLYALLCASIMSQPGSPQNACQKAFEASLYGYQLDSKVQKVGQLVQLEAERRSNKAFIDSALGAAGIVRSREVKLRTRVLPIADVTTLRVTPDTGSLSLGWNF